MQASSAQRSMEAKSSQTASVVRLLAICGIVAPILFTTVVVVLGSLQPGYSHLSQTISSLGSEQLGAAHAAIQNINFVVTGMLMLAFAFGLQRGIGDGKGSKVGPVLVAYWGMALIASGFFQQGNLRVFTPTTIMQGWAGGLHNLAGLTGFAASAAAALVLPRRLKTDARWRSYGSFSVVAGLLMIVFLVGFMQSFGLVPAYTGAIQRLMVGTILLWTEVMAIRLFQISRRPQRVAQGRLDGDC